MAPIVATMATIVVPTLAIQVLPSTLDLQTRGKDGSQNTPYMLESFSHLQL